MPARVIVSYDGTANEDDAIILGRIFADAGAEVSLAYVRHVHEAQREAETLAEHEAEALLQRGVELFGGPVARNVVTDRSTPEGLAALAEREGADVIAFCSDSHTAKGHLSIGNSASRLLEGGRTAIAIAPVDLADQGPIQQIVAVGDGEGGARETAESLAAALGATVAPVANAQTGMIVVDSRAEGGPGLISLSSSATHLIEIANCPVLVVPRGVTVRFGEKTPVPQPTAPAAA